MVMLLLLLRNYTITFLGSNLMTFDELLTEVYLLTNRPDLVNETTSAVKAATLKAHTSDYYSKDIFESGVEFAESSYLQSLDYISLVSNFRTLKYIKRVDSATDQVGAFITIVTPEEVLDSYNRNRNDIAYVAGRVLEIRSSVAFSKALIGMYVFPLVTPAKYSSWVADQFPYAVAYEAARVVFKAIGFEESANSFARLALEEFTLLRQSGLTDVGY